MQQQQTTEPEPQPMPSQNSVSGSAAPPLPSSNLTPAGVQAAPAPTTTRTTPVAAPPNSTVAATVPIAPAQRVRAPASRSAGAAKAASWFGLSKPNLILGYFVAAITILLLLASHQNFVPCLGCVFLSALTLTISRRRRQARAVSTIRWIVSLLRVLAIVCVIATGALVSAAEQVQQVAWTEPFRADPWKAVVFGVNAGACAFILAEQVRLLRQRRGLASRKG